MNETLGLVMAWLAGCAIGAVFFGGLWWTVRKAVSSRQPAMWFLGSLLLRMGVAVAGFCRCLQRSLGAAAVVPHRICHGSPGRDVADAAVWRAPRSPCTGGLFCALVPTS